jgi:hypothetical protein
MRERLTFANVMSLIAVFFALGGGAYAISLGKGDVKAKNIAKNAVRSKHIKADSATGADIDESTLDTVPTAENAQFADDADLANDSNTLQGLFPLDFGLDWAEAGHVDQSDSAFFPAIAGDVQVACDATPTVQWDDLDGDGVVTDVWINGTHEELPDGNSSAEYPASPPSEHTAEIHAWGGDDSISIIHVSVAFDDSADPSLDNTCAVAYSAHENFNFANLVSASARQAAIERLEALRAERESGVHGLRTR